MKRIGLGVVVMVLFLSGAWLAVPLGNAAGKAPEISALKLEGEDADGVSRLKTNETRELLFKFTSNSRPDEVSIRFYGSLLGGSSTFSTFYRSSEGEVKTQTTSSSDGTYDVSAAVTKKLTSPPRASDSEVSLWIKAAGEESNKLTKKLEVR